MKQAEEAKKVQETWGWDSTLPAEAEQKEFPVAPIGEYNFIVVEVEKTYSQSSGNPMLKVRLDLQGADGCVFDYLVVSEKAMFKLITFFESVGVKTKGQPLTISVSEAADKAVGMEGRCKIKHETYNGELRARIDKYIVLEKKAPKKLTKEDEEALDMPFPLDD